MARSLPVKLDVALETALQPMIAVDILVGHRTICHGDENALMLSETPGFVGSVESVRRQSGAARIAARRILSGCGYRNVALPRSASGAPSWPHGIIGSLAHDGTIALAAIALSKTVIAFGVDVEPAAELPSELVDLVATPLERVRYSRDVLGSRLLFVIKEAVYKATNPLDGKFLDFHDVEVDLDVQSATTLTGHRLWIAFAVAPRVAALAFMTRTDIGSGQPGCVERIRKCKKLG